MGAQPLAYCPACTRRAAEGFLHDTGTDAPWQPLALWSLRELGAELGGLPSRAQVARLGSTSDPVAADRGMVIRMHVPRPGTGTRRGAPERAPLTWADWLHRAGLLADGLPTARGTMSVAADGHLCRSLLERHIDDFLSANGIAHELEPYWPYDPELNTSGMRADWLLGDGTYVEAWGLPDEPVYAGRMERKAELAARTGIRLAGVTAADLGRLHEIFAPWLANPAPPPGRADARLRRPAKPRPAVTQVNARNTGLRTARLERCREAVALQATGLSRAAIAEKLGVGPDSLKELLRDGKFYADPDTDPVRHQLAGEAAEARRAGSSKGRFRTAKALTAPKANEAWRDADVLFPPA